MREQREVWRPIPGFGGMYEISRFGEIRSWYISGFGGWGAKRETPVLLKAWPYRQEGRLTLRVNLRRRRYCVKLLMRDIWMDGDRPGMVVKQVDGDYTNCALTNLRYVPLAEHYVSTAGHNRRVVAKCTPLGEVIELYPSLMEAGRKNYLSRSGMFHRLQSGTSIDGVVFRYAETIGLEDAAT